MATALQGYCIWIRGTEWEVIPLTATKLVRWLTLLAWQVISFILAVAGTIADVLSDLETIIYTAIVGVIFFFWWYYYPDLQPYLSTTGVDLVNLFLQLFQLFWNLFIILWNLAVMVWNAVCPIIGMLIYVALEVGVKILSAIVEILGQVDVYALLRPVMEILEVVTRIFVEIVQALVAVAIDLLQVFAKIVGALINVVFAVIKVLFPIVKWVVGLLFKLLFPILKVVCAIVRWFLNLFAARSSRSLLEWNVSADAYEKLMLAARGNARKLNQLAEQEIVDSDVGFLYTRLHESMYPQAYEAGRPYWGNEENNRAKDLELENILHEIDANPLHSFDYYWAVSRPYLQGVSDNYNVHFYTGENDYYPGQRENRPEYYNWTPNGRALLGIIEDRQLLTREETETLSKRQATSSEEYWKKHDSSDASDDLLEWDSRRHNLHHRNRRAVKEKLRLKLAAFKFEHPDEYYELYARNETSVRPGASFDEFTSVRDLIVKRDAADSSSGTAPKTKRHRPFVKELGARLKCHHKACGGKQATLPHPVHPLRRSVERRQARTDMFNWKPTNMSEEDYRKSRFIHGHAIAHAMTEGTDTLKWRLQDPRLHRQVRDAFKRLTNHDSLGDMLDTYHENYNDPAEWLYDKVGSLSDLPAFRWAAEIDPHFDSRPYFGDWARKELSIRDHPSPYHSRKLQGLDDPIITRPPIQLLEPETAQEAAEIEEWKTREPKPTIAAVVRDIQHMYTHAPHSMDTGRKLNDLPFPLPDVPDAYQQAQDAARRDQEFKTRKPQPKAKLPLFELLIRTNCYNTNPRNPLCLPSIPSSWSITKVPTVVWPENATADDSFCAPTFKLIKRDLTDWQTYLSWKWYYNALQIPRLILSAIPVFTDTIYQLCQTYPFLCWLLKLPLALPPGHTPDALDWICAAIYGPYALWLAYVTFKIISWLLPLARELFDGIIALWALNNTFVEEDDGRWNAYQANFERRLQVARLDSPANPSLYTAGNGAADPYYFYRGANGMVPSYYPNYGGDPAHLRDPRVAPYNGQGAAPGFTNSAYQPGVRLTPNQYLQRNAPYVYDPETRTAEYAGVPTGLPGVRESGQEIERTDHENVRMQLQTLKHELARCVYELGVPNHAVPDVETHGSHNVNLLRRLWQWFIDERVTQSDLIRFDRTYRLILGSFHDSLVWNWQHRNLVTRNFWERIKFQPASGPRLASYMLPSNGDQATLSSIVSQ